MNTSTFLAILQQSEYDFKQFREWYELHKNHSQKIEPKEWTLKLKLISLLLKIFFFLPFLTRVQLAVTLVQPIEAVIRQSIYLRARLKLRALKSKGLTVVAIAGSYGKTSTKTILEHAFSEKFSIFVTPKSINTLLGVAQVILKELKPSHQIFVVEMGEYHQGDIKKLCQFVGAKYGILTPIGRQHLDIIGGFENILKEMHDFVSSFSHPAEEVILVDKNKQYFNDETLKYYGTERFTSVTAKEVHVTRGGTEYSVEETQHGETKTLFYFIPLYGEHQALNTLPAIWLAGKLGIEAKAINKRLNTLPYVPHRHEPSFMQNNVLVLDNGYNTNPDSVKESLKLVNALEPSVRIIVTLGFVETGKYNEELHKELGKLLATSVDYVGLIASPSQDYILQGFIEAGGQKNQVVIGKDQQDTIQKIQQWVQPNAVILLEGGFQELYS